MNMKTIEYKRTGMYVHDYTLNTYVVSSQTVVTEYDLRCN
jgi:hypothetical protein